MRAALLWLIPAAALAAPEHDAFLRRNCAGCHGGASKQGGLDVAAPSAEQWVKIHDRVKAGEMPPAPMKTPADAPAFVKTLASELEAVGRRQSRTEGRALDRRLNRLEYENALRDLLSAPWLQIKGAFPEDGEAYRFNKSGEALDISHVHLARYLSAADYAIRQAMSVRFAQPPTTTVRYYAREQGELTRKVNHSNQRGDRQVYPILGWQPEPLIYEKRAPFTVGAADPAKRELEAMAWVSSNYVTGFRYDWDGFRAPVAGRYRVRFSGYTIWVPPLPGDRKHLADFEKVQRGRRNEPVTVYTRRGVLNRRVGEFDLTPEPGVHEVGEVWLAAGETLVPDASRLFRSRPNNFRNPLMQADGTPGVAFRWMEVDGPLYDESTPAGYRVLFGDLPLRKAQAGGVDVPVGEGAAPVEAVTADPERDAERLLRRFIARAYRRPVAEADVQRFLRLIRERRQAGLSFTEAMLAGYTAVLASPPFVFLNEKPGALDNVALATRLSLFLNNAPPSPELLKRARAAAPLDLRAETERLLAHPQRFVESFLDYWLDLRKMEDSTPSTTLYNDYYLDDALAEAALAETHLYFGEMLHRDLPVRLAVASDFTYANDRLAAHYGIPGVEGIAMRRIALPPDSPRGGFMTQASILKLTANGTTTSPVLRGKWVMERLLGFEAAPPPAVPAVEPDIRGAVTIRQQLEKHRADKSCAACHARIDPPGFALESFDVMGGWRDRYRAVDENVPGIPGRGKNGQPFVFHYALPVDAGGVLPDGRAFRDVRELKTLLLQQEEAVARNLVRQLVVFATGAPVRFSDRAEVERILAAAKPGGYGLRSLIHGVVASELFRVK